MRYNPVMCGILGLYRPGGAFDAADAERRLIQGVKALLHRGPDASGIESLAKDGVAFAHRRLAILDLDKRANQPMRSKDGSLLITFNGEIYNFRELREELRSEGGVFRTQSDTEVLLEGYRLWGIERLLERVAGMFAFGLYDANRKTLILARDRAGKKPLFYSEADGGLAFSSELRGLFKLLPKRPELSPEGLDAYLALKFVPPPRTLIKGIESLPPACWLEARDGGAVQVREYWTPWRGAPAPASPAAAIERLDDAFTTAVKRRLVSDVPVCLFLSGGVDSSLTAAYVSRLGVRDMAAYSIGYSDLPGYSEFEYSRMVADKFPVRYEELTLTAKDAIETLEDERCAVDEPVSDWVWVPLYHLSRKAHRDGFKVALVGEGSDELFFGYDVMLKGLKQMRRFRNPALRLAAKAGAPLLAPVYKRVSRGHRKYDLLRRVAEGGPVYMGSSIGFPRSQRHQIIGPNMKGKGDPQAGLRFLTDLHGRYDALAPDASDDANRVCYVEFKTKMVEVLLQRVDRVSMLESLEARSPFLDQDLIELAFAVPGEWKAPRGRLKGLLKDLAARHLPEPILTRPKMGFSFPFKEWLRGDLGEFVDKSIATSRLFADGWLDRAYFRSMLAQHRSGRVDHAPRLWMVFDLCRWYDRWLA